MKTILAPTDFSEVANNAVHYAASLANHFNAPLALLHSIAIPVLNGDTAVALPFDELEKDSQDELQKLRNALLAKFSKLSVTVLTKIGFAGDVIIEMTSNKAYEFVVMGISGAGKLDSLMGSVATKVAKDAVVPSLIIPHDRHFELPKTIVAAFDLKEAKKGPDFDMLVHIAKVIPSKITAVNVLVDEQRMEKESKKWIELTDQLFEGIEHDFVTLSAPGIVEGIKDYCTAHPTDLLVMLKRKHGFFDLLLNGSKTHAMAFQTSIPLLILHE